MSQELDIVTVFGRSFVGICEFELKTFCLEKLEDFFFRPTPSWLSPGRSTCFIACCKMGLID